MSTDLSDCGWYVGPIWKLDGETCVCTLPANHAMPHVCTCGAWFEGCGYPPWWSVANSERLPTG